MRLTQSIGRKSFFRAKSSGNRPKFYSVPGQTSLASARPFFHAIVRYNEPRKKERLIPGGVICCYVATTTQLGRVMDTFRAHGGFTEPTATETTVRDWHAEGLAIRPGHGTSAHTGFLVLSRRLAPGVSAPIRKRRPAPGAYGPDYQGPRPLNMPESDR